MRYKTSFYEGPLEGSEHTAMGTSGFNPRLPQGLSSASSSLSLTTWRQKSEDPSNRQHGEVQQPRAGSLCTQHNSEKPSDYMEGIIQWELPLQWRALISHGMCYSSSVHFVIRKPPTILWFKCQVKCYVGCSERITFWLCFK